MTGTFLFAMSLGVALTVQAIILSDIIKGTLNSNNAHDTALAVITILAVVLASVGFIIGLTNGEFK